MSTEETTQTSTNEVIKTEEKPEETPKTETVTIQKEDSNKSVLEAIAGIQTNLDDSASKIEKKFEEMDAKFKALEKPTDLPLKPKGTEGGDDIGAKVKVPDTYQSNSIQAGIREASPGNESSNDKGGLKMQEKTQEQPAEQTEAINKAEPEHTFNTTQTPRGGVTVESVIQNVLKGAQDDYCPVLKMAREVGIDNINKVQAAIKRGDFYQPSAQELEDQITW